MDNGKFTELLLCLTTLIFSLCATFTCVFYVVFGADVIVIAGELDLFIGRPRGPMMSDFFSYFVVNIRYFVCFYGFFALFSFIILFLKQFRSRHSKLIGILLLCFSLISSASLAAIFISSWVLHAEVVDSMGVRIVSYVEAFEAAPMLRELEEFRKKGEDIRIGTDLKYIEVDDVSELPYEKLREMVSSRLDLWPTAIGTGMEESLIATILKFEEYLRNEESLSLRFIEHYESYTRLNFKSAEDAINHAIEKSKKENWVPFEVKTLVNIQREEWNLK